MCVHFLVINGRFRVFAVSDGAQGKNRVKKIKGVATICFIHVSTEIALSASLATSSSSFSTRFLYTRDFMCLQKKKSSEVMSGDRGGKANCPKFPVGISIRIVLCNFSKPKPKLCSTIT